MSSVYDPNGGTLHDLAAALTRWAVGEGDIVAHYEIVQLIVANANREYGKNVPSRAIAHDALFAFPKGFNRTEIQRNYNLVRKYYA